LTVLYTNINRHSITIDNNNLFILVRNHVPLNVRSLEKADKQSEGIFLTYNQSYNNNVIDKKIRWMIRSEIKSNPFQLNKSHEKNQVNFADIAQEQSLLTI